MKMAELNALSRLAMNRNKKVVYNDKLEHVFRCENKLYACNGVSVVEVEAQEVKYVDESYYDWKVFDLKAAADYRKVHGFVDLNTELVYVHEGDLLEKTRDWRYDCFSRFFERKIEGHSNVYDAKELALIMNVFKAFGMPVAPTFDEGTNLQLFVGEGNNYRIRALAYPLRRG
jgi:hypothetical protein